MAGDAFRLIRLDGGGTHDLPAANCAVIGRGLEVEITIADPTLSRRHAELQCTPQGVNVRDLGSSNGTCINGVRVADGLLTPGDIVTFGKVAFRLESATPAAPEDLIVRQRSVTQPIPVLTAPSDGTTVMAAVRSTAQELTQRKLALLLEVSTALSRVTTTDALLEQIAGYVFQIMDVDRLAILMTEQDGSLSTRIARDRQGGETARVVPRSIARRVVDEKIAVVSANAPEDQRFAGESIVMQSVRSAMCAPLIGLEGTVLGVLYVDNLHVTQSFSDDDLAFLVAFCGIAAVSIENGRYAERVRREALTRGNFERFFTPALAARIASSPDALTLGGEKRRVVILFSDIRGFTPMSEGMPPDELAALLNEYYTSMVECVFSHGGTLDKFIGDAILAQWGAPVSAADDADRALAAAFDMLDSLRVLNARWAAQGRAQLNIGIGLNAGEVFAGYIGSERRLEYTILGDAVNTANRLCSVAESSEILVSEELLSDLHERPPLEERTNLKLKGLSRVLRVFAVSRPGI